MADTWDSPILNGQGGGPPVPPIFPPGDDTNQQGGANGWSSDEEQNSGNAPKAEFLYYFSFSHKITQYERRTCNPYLFEANLNVYRAPIEEAFASAYGNLTGTLFSKYVMLEICKGQLPEADLTPKITVKGSLSSSNDFRTLLSLVRANVHSSASKCLVQHPIFNRHKLQRQVEIFKSSPLVPISTETVSSLLEIKVSELSGYGFRELLVCALQEIANISDLKAIQGDRDIIVLKSAPLQLQLSGRCQLSVLAATLMAAVTHSDESEKLSFLLKIKSHAESLATVKKKELGEGELAYYRPHYDPRTNHILDTGGASLRTGKEGSGTKGGLGGIVGQQGHTLAGRHVFFRTLADDEKKKVCCPFGPACKWWPVGRCQFSHSKSAFVIHPARPLNPWLRTQMQRYVCTPAEEDLPLQQQEGPKKVTFSEKVAFQDGKV